MEYQVLARKWRPQQFDDVVGQEHVTTTLKNAIERERVAHAYIFTGPRGIGKTSTARILAKALNCAEGASPQPCDSCESCRGIIAGNSLDVLEIDGASNRGIDQIRELRENVKFAPSFSRYKIYIIDEVHQITHDAFNALLKTLEEPPAHVKFFFATTEPHKVPATILSRCQRFDMRSIAAGEIVERIRRVAGEEKIEIDEEACFALARYAQGSMRDAESILDQLVSFSEGRIGPDDVVSMLGLVRESVLQEMTEALISGDTRRGLEVIAEVAAVGKDLTLFLGDWISYLRGVMLVIVLGDAGSVSGVSPEAVKVLLEQSGKITREQIIYVLDELTRAEQQMRWALSPRVMLELAFMKAARAKLRTSVPEILQKIRALQERLGGKPGGEGGDRGGPSRGGGTSPAGKTFGPVGKAAPVERPAPPKARRGKPGSSPADTPSPRAREAAGAPPRKGVVNDDRLMEGIKNVWPEVLDRVGSVRPMLKSCLLEGTLSRCKEGVLIVEFGPRYEFQCRSLEDAGSRKIVMKVLAEKLGRETAVRFAVSAGSAKEHPARPTAKAGDIRNLKKNPVIQSAIEMFGARIVEVRH